VIRARVVVASNRAFAGIYRDTSGPLLAAGLRELGCAVDDPIVVVPDGDPVGAALRTAAAEGVDVMLVEQNAEMALEIAAHAFILERGEIQLEGPAAELASSEAVRKAYLGI